MRGSRGRGSQWLAGGRHPTEGSAVFHCLAQAGVTAPEFGFWTLGDASQLWALAEQGKGQAWAEVSE